MAISSELLERLASIEHERWAHWQRFVHDQGERQPNGGLLLAPELISKWDRLINTPYARLTMEEQESDREQVRRYLPLIDQTYGEVKS